MFHVLFEKSPLGNLVIEYHRMNVEVVTCRQKKRKKEIEMYLHRK